MKKYLLIPLLAMNALSFAATAKAQEFDEIGLTIKPALVEVVGKPGQTVVANIDIQNISAEPVGVKIGSRSLLPNDPEIDQSRRGDFDASQWIEPESDGLLLEKNQQKQAKINIVIPKDVGPGGHYALITYRTVGTSPGTTADSNTQANPELTTVLFVTVPGLIDEEATTKLNDFSKFQFNKEMDLVATLSNTGNIHLLPLTEFRVMGSNGDLVERISVPAALTLPNTIKTLAAAWNPDGKFGKFTIEASIVYGTPTQTDVIVSQEIYVLPTLLTIGLWVSLIIATIFSMITFRKWPTAAKRLAGRPLQLIRGNKQIEERSGEKHTNKGKTLSKISVDDRTLDDLSTDRRIPDQQMRSIQHDKEQPSKTIIDADESSYETKQYIKSISVKDGSHHEKTNSKIKVKDTNKSQKVDKKTKKSKHSK